MDRYASEFASGDGFRLLAPCERIVINDPNKNTPVPSAMPNVPRLMCSRTLRVLTRIDWTTSNVIQLKKNAPCRCTTGGSGASEPDAIGIQYVNPKPLKMNSVMTIVMHKKNEKRKVARVSVGMAAAIAVLSAMPASRNSDRPLARTRRTPRAP